MSKGREVMSVAGASLGDELTEVLYKHEPLLLKADVDASARAAAQVANLLGCIMATVMVQRPDTYRAALAAVVQQVHRSAEQTAAIAVPTMTQQ